MNPQTEQQLIAVLQQISHELHRINASIGSLQSYLQNIATAARH